MKVTKLLFVALFCAMTTVALAATEGSRETHSMIKSTEEMTPIGEESNGKHLLNYTPANKKMAIEVGGYFNLRASYDFGGIVQHHDFPVSCIPSSDTGVNQQFIMDASTSRIFIKAVTHSKILGDVNFLVNFDFRGGSSYNNGFKPSYIPRIRLAYVTFKGFTLGRDITTFCDLDATSRIVDFQGPNAYPFNYSTLIRYQYSGLSERFATAVALEAMDVSGSYGDEFVEIAYRSPDVLGYVEYKLGKNMDHRLRLTGVLRDIYLYNNVVDSKESLLGWGAQLSGNTKVASWLNVCFNGIYGEAITPYIQDLIGSGLDFAPNASDVSILSATPMYAYQAAATIYFSKKISGSAGYSVVQVDDSHGIFTTDTYSRGEYAFSNLFYDLTNHTSLSVEYIHGVRENMDSNRYKANRISLMAQFDF